ncbi:hypothetical protein NY538_16110, partial [Enterobacter hormaechei]|uniref:hypothetical protein n=1 Tax=Enterobacter hormaechei TaxID=158836 RepID=UPI0022F093F5
IFPRMASPARSLPRRARPDRRRCSSRITSAARSDGALEARCGLCRVLEHTDSQADPTVER